MSIKQQVTGNSVELHLVLQARDARIDEIRNKIRDKITDMHRNWRSVLLTGVDGAFNALFISVERFMSKMGPVLGRLVKVEFENGPEVDGRHAPAGYSRETKTKGLLLEGRYGEKEESMIEESRRVIEKANKLRGKFIQSSLHNLKIKSDKGFYPIVHGKGEKNGKRSGN